jgi:membrane protease YdiL (CAAX protease family)
MTRDPIRALIQTGVFALLYVVIVFITSGLFKWLGGYLVGLTMGGLVAAAMANGLAMRIFPELPLVQLGLHWNQASARNMLLGLAGGMGSATLVLGGAVLFRAAEFVASPDAGANWRTVLFVPVLLLCGAMGEELLFHGFAFQVLLRQFGLFSAVLPIGVLFGLLHGNNPNATTLGVINTAGFGILFGLAFARSHDLWLPIGLHFGWNFTLPLFGVNLSGITMKPTAVTLVWKVGPLWSGGDYGPEASILTSGVLLLLLVYIWKAPVRRQFAPLVDGQPESSPSA